MCDICNESKLEISGIHAHTNFIISFPFGGILNYNNLLQQMLVEA
jgi:hypothetical protein